MTPPSAAHAADATPSTASADSIAEAVVFLARFFGTAVQAERLRASVLAHGDPAAADFLDQALAHGSLAGTALPVDQPRRPTEMPALLLNGAGQALVMLTIADGKYECHVPGIEGSSWLDAAMLVAGLGLLGFMARRRTAGQL